MVLKKVNKTSDFLVTVETKAKNVLTSQQTRGFVYIVGGALIMIIMRKFEVNFLLPMICGLIHIYIYRSIGIPPTQRL